MISRTIILSDGRITADIAGGLETESMNIHECPPPPFPPQAEVVPTSECELRAASIAGFNFPSPSSTMLQPRLYRPVASPEACLAALASSLNALSLCSAHALPQTQASITSIRHASHASQGRANGPKDSAGRRLGAKKTASEFVIPGNIIFKQRGPSCNECCLRYQ